MPTTQATTDKNQVEQSLNEIKTALEQILSATGQECLDRLEKDSPADSERLIELASVHQQAEGAYAHLLKLTAQRAQSK